MSEADPYIKIILENIQDLEAHARANRAHAEQGLYSEAIPRIILLAKNIVNAIDYENRDDPEELDDPEMKGAVVAIRYQTARTLEDILTAIYQSDPSNATIAGTLSLLLEDLHGMEPAEVAKFLTHATGKKDEKPPTEAETTEQ